MTARRRRAKGGLASIFRPRTSRLLRLPTAYREALDANRLFDGYNQTAMGLLSWRDHLLKGAVPPEDELWPTGSVGRAIAGWVSTSGVLRLCESNQDITDSFVLEILRVALLCQKAGQEEVERRLREWFENERCNRESSRNFVPVSPSEKAAARLRISRAFASEPCAMASDLFSEVWNERIHALSCIHVAFGDFGRRLNLGWDLSKGVLRMTGWENVMRIHELLKKVPQISDIARTIGRLREAEGEDVVESKRVVKAMSRVVEELRMVRIPTMRSQMDGVERSADIPRMLPSEAMLLRHPRLRRLWKARFLERALASYRMVGYGYEKVRRTETEEVEVDEVSRRKLERGPIIACLDTSGSMRDNSAVPETVAKAITFELMRLAAAEGRKCFLYTFSGPGNLAGVELSLDENGLKGIIDLLSMSFCGGTDISDPMRAATRKVSESGWSRADIIMVSDGQFYVPDDILRLVNECRAKRGLRVHGLIVGGGGHGDSAMRQLCDPLHHFNDWASVSCLS